jgi:hypothetical protein
MFARVVGIALRLAIVRYDGILHALNDPLLILGDTVRLFHAGQKRQRSFGTRGRLNRTGES